ncbi:RagB/SusD family nutrient uptake outer membrane protein [Hymenobacter sp. 15J16-1T3B]|uniref:RagB/SusD family nutrient uptake outer membrane protein n=1 Tax=Hymenobacter sp. 15J16-1T3B TaxID=2886941 RepID=UPI001D10C391|nr:RagB/SusD family nutrient uptake outer membrane protein [Hymenobacter sp. 15J16-1T3B]MCC3159301.1 RagB/SusD family nutrient uptake outer membrane protein [Hymenobacter sp. 15J16-1T3B]
MKNKFTRTLGALALAALLLPAVSSCVGDLDQTPEFDAVPDVVYRDPAQVKQVLARLYATLAVSGQQGPAGQPDITGIDEGFSNYLRQYWMAQELPTDEAIIAWNDGNLPDYNKLTWNANNNFVRAMYDRIFYQISLCNEFIRQTTEDRMSERGLSDGDKATIRVYRAEARFLRALSYWHAIDMFGNVPFADETAAVGGSLPQQKSRAEVFTFIETELKAIEGDLLPPRAEYARADKGACWTLLTKLYLNAQVYTGTPRYNEAVFYANEVLTKGGYSLAPAYRNLFRTDNNRAAARNEIIFPVTSDGRNTKTYGGMTFLVHAPVGGALDAFAADSFGIAGGWGGVRAKSTLVDKFDGGATSSDRRAMFFTTGQSRDISDIFTFSQGYLMTKYRNISSTGVPGTDAKVNGGEGNFIDTDFPMFRLADVELMYVEAVLRGGTGGSNTQALTYLNDIRRRAGATQFAALPTGSQGLQTVLDERARELYWEGHRRTDLIRYGLFTSGNYVWPFKGGTAVGQGVAARFNLFPIPTTDLVANPNLQQNDPGY